MSTHLNHLDRYLDALSVLGVCTSELSIRRDAANKNRPKTSRQQNPQQNAYNPRNYTSQGIARTWNHRCVTQRVFDLGEHFLYGHVRLADKSETVESRKYSRRYESLNRDLRARHKCGVR